MTPRLCDPSAPKKPVNLSINSDLLRQARDLKLNLSRALEERLLEVLKEERTRRWQDENREAIEAYNRFVDGHGVFGDPRR